MKREHPRPKIGTKWRKVQGCALGLFLALTGIGTAKADSFTCDTVPSTFNGDIDINQTTACAISTGVSASGHVNISAPSVEVDGNVSAGTSLTVTASASTINITGAISFNNAHTGGNAILLAQGDIATGSITAAEGGSTAAVDIKANLAGGNHLFTVNGSGQANGVNGTVTAVGVFIANGGDTSTGGITLSGTTPITIQSYSGNSTSTAGLFLDAKQGTITLPSGTLSADASGAGLPAGTIALAAAEIDAPNGSLLSASNDGTGWSTIFLSATTINSGSDFTVHADGGNKQVAFLPTGRITFTDSLNANSLSWSAAVDIYTSSGTLNLNAGGHNFVATANGLGSSLSLTGDAVSITANDVTLQTQGNSNSLTFPINSLAFNVTDSTSIDASGGAPGGSGGNIALYPGTLTVTGNRFSVNANGPATGDGAGGNIVSYANNPTLDLTVTNASMTANGSGTANGGTIFMSDLTATQIGANAGSTGSGGTITIQPTHAFNPTSLTVTANGGTDGNGGQISLTLVGGGDYIDSSNSFTATGGTASGNGGALTLTVPDYLTLSYPTIDLSAPGVGNGGTLSANISDGVILYAVGTINLQAQVDGQGGQVNFTGSANIYSTVNASGANSGKGGSFTASGQNFTLQYGGQLLLNGGTNADGGTVSVTTTGSDPLDWSTAGTISLNAGTLSGNGGSLSVNSASTLTLGGTITANGSGDTGNGGTINVTGTAPVDLSGMALNSISALGAGFGTGGRVSFGSVSAEPATASIDKIIAVSGGADLYKSDFDGSIALNGITCQQWLRFDVWPRSYWNCANQASPTDNEEKAPAAAASLPPEFTTVLDTQPAVSLFVMNKGSDFSTFFQYSGVDDTAFGAHVDALHVAAVFDNSTAPGALTDVSNYLSGALMHQIGSLLDTSNGSPSQQTGVGTFGEAALADQNQMIGNYPAVPQAPTCTDVFNDSTFCGNHSTDGNPWISFQNAYIGTQNTNSEMFAYAFQNCSGNAAYSAPLNNAEQSAYMNNVYGWFNTKFWPNGCNWIPASQPIVAVNSVAVANRPAQAIIGGSVSANDTLTITVRDSALPGGQEQVSYVVQTGDTKADIATGLASAIQSDASLQAIGVTAFSTTASPDSVVNITSTSPNSTAYSSSVNSGATETITLAANPNLAENSVVGGTTTAGDVFTVNITDAALPGGQQTVSYTVVADDTPTSIAMGLAASASANAALQQVGITAVASSGVVTFKSSSLNLTTYSGSVTTGSSGTISLSASPNYIQDFVVGGSPMPGNVIALSISDGLTFSEDITYQVASGDTIGSIACGLQSAFNADANLTQLGLTASCNSSGILSIESDSFPSLINYHLIVDFKSRDCLYVFGYQGPGSLLACGTALPSDSQVKYAKIALQSIGTYSLASDAAKMLQKAHYVKWYVYGNRSEFKLAEYSLRALSPNPSVFREIPVSAKGATWQGGAEFQEDFIFTVIFETYGTFPYQVNGQIAYTTAHETGHLVDVLYGGGPGWSGKGTSPIPFSAGGDYIGAWSKDKQFATLVPACAFNASDRRAPNPNNPNDHSGIYGYYSTNPLSGFFTGKSGGTAGADGTFICSQTFLADGYNGSLNGSDNLSIMQKAYPQSYFWIVAEPSNLWAPNEELFADEFAYLVGFPDRNDSELATPNTYGSYRAFELNDAHGGSWECSLLFTDIKIQTNSEPSTGVLTTTGTSEPLTFGGDSTGVTYGPQNITGNPPFVGEKFHPCSGAPRDGIKYEFGNTGGG